MMRPGRRRVQAALDDASRGAVSRPRCPTCGSRLHLGPLDPSL